MIGFLMHLFYHKHGHKRRVDRVSVVFLSFSFENEVQNEFRKPNKRESIYYAKRIS
jgi:hypothetical protein